MKALLPARRDQNLQIPEGRHHDLPLGANDHVGDVPDPRRTGHHRDRRSTAVLDLEGMDSDSDTETTDEQLAFELREQVTLVEGDAGCRIVDPELVDRRDEGRVANRDLVDASVVEDVLAARRVRLPR